MTRPTDFNCKKIGETILVVTFVSNLEKDELQEIREKLDPKLLNETFERVIFNLNETGKVDSTGFGWITYLRRMLAERKTNFYLCHLKKDVYNIFKIVRLDDLITAFETEAEALAYKECSPHSLSSNPTQPSP